MDKYAVIGNPIEHSLSPKLHQGFAKQTQQAISYEKILVAMGGLEAALKDLQQQGYKGLNVTQPFKQQAYELMDRLSPEAQQARAVNTIIFEPSGQWHGYNTDGIGLCRDIEKNIGLDLHGLNIAILGAGGAARGILASLLQKNIASIALSNRTQSKAEILAKDFELPENLYIYPWGTIDWLRVDLIINTTSIRHADDFFAKETKLSHCCCYDIVYGKNTTAFLQAAESLGCIKLFDGLGMLTEQAAESFFLWRGVKPL